MQTLEWYWNRLTCMSPSEVGLRAWRKSRVLLAEPWGRVDFVDQSPLAKPRGLLVPAVAQFDVAPYLREAADASEGRVRVFALDDAKLGSSPVWNRDPASGRIAPDAQARRIDYRDPEQVGDIKYLWEPNRHLHLVRLAQAFRLTGDTRWRDRFAQLLGSWIDQCPVGRGPNWTSALEAGIRLINWSWAWELFGSEGGDRAWEIFRRRWIASVHAHIDFISANYSEYSSANNHLIGELAGVYVGTRVWSCSGRAARQGDSAGRRLIDEALRQNTTDGVNREQALAYQQFVLDFLIIAGLVGRRCAEEFPREYWRRIEAMCVYLASMMDAAGQVPQIGDADEGFVVRLSPETGFCPFRSMLATGAILFGRADLKAKAGGLDDKTRWLIGPDADREWTALPPLNPPYSLPRAFPEGGYYVLGKDLDTPREVRAIVDVGPLGYLRIAAHGHADALSVLLSIRGREILIDPGTYAYHTKRRWRDYFRGSAAHNTLTVDDRDQSVSGGNFMWLRHANAVCERWTSTASEDWVVGSHDGYLRLRDPVLHRRSVRLDKANSRITILDMVACAGEHSVARHWHFSEACRVEALSGGIRVISGDVAVELRHGPESVSAETLRGSETRPGGWVSRRFDVRRPSTTVVWHSRIRGTTVLRTDITYS